VRPLLLLLTVLFALTACDKEGGPEPEAEPEVEAEAEAPAHPGYDPSPSMPQFESAPAPNPNPDAGACIDLFPPDGITKMGGPDWVVLYLSEERPDGMEGRVDSVLEELREIADIASDTLRPSVLEFIEVAATNMSARDEGRPIDLEAVVLAGAEVYKACGDNIT